jgi:hypothetical protein
MTAFRPTIRQNIAERVLASAKAAGAADLANAARRCLTAWRNGEKAPAADWAMVQTANGGF